MKQLFVLSKENIDLSVSEVLRLYNVEKYDLVDNLLIIDSAKDFSKRLAYSHEVHQFLFKTDLIHLEKKMESFNWEKVYDKSFSITIRNNSQLDEKKLAGYIWRNVNNPKVDLKNAKTKIILNCNEDKMIGSRLICVNDKSYLKRKAHLRPSLHPTSLNPGLARACINLSGKSQGNILDPFCGSGGILIEAGFMGYNVFGVDYHQEMLDRCKKNLDYYKIKKYDLSILDARHIKGKYDCIVTDIPYGKSSKVDKDMASLIHDFLENAYDITDRMVLMVPDFFDYKTICSKWKIELEFTHYLHKSLSKKIFVLIKN